MSKKKENLEQKFFDEWLERQNLLFGIGGRLQRIPDEKKVAGPVYCNGHFILNSSFSLAEPWDRSLLVGETISDILRIWDCDNQSWGNDTPIVIRLEDDDVSLWMDNNYQVQAYLGCIKTELPIDICDRADTGNSINHDSALTWLTDSRLSCFIGETIEDIFECKRTDESDIAIFAIRLSSGYDLEFFASKRRPSLDITCHYVPKWNE